MMLVAHHRVPGRPARAGHADAIAGGDDDAVEFHGVLRIRGEGVLLGERHPAGARIEEEEIDVGIARAAAGEDDEPRGGLRERHVAFRAGEPVAGALGRRAELNPGGPEAAVRLEPGGCQDRCAISVLSAVTWTGCRPGGSRKKLAPTAGNGAIRCGSAVAGGGTDKK
jgi:hypothetical protein